MRFTKIGLELLLSELAGLPSEWMDDEARRLVGQIPVAVERLRAIGPKIDAMMFSLIATSSGSQLVYDRYILA